MEYKNIKVYILNNEKNIDHYHQQFNKIINHNENVVRLFINKNKCWGEAFKICPITGEKIFFTVSSNKRRYNEIK